MNWHTRHIRTILLSLLLFSSFVGLGATSHKEVVTSGRVVYDVFGRAVKVYHPTVDGDTVTAFSCEVDTVRSACRSGPSGWSLSCLVWPCIKVVPRWWLTQNFCLTLTRNRARPPCRCPYIGRVLLKYISYLSSVWQSLSYWISDTWPNFISYILLK